MKKVVIAMLMVVLIGVLVLETITLIKIVNARQQLETIQNIY